MDDSSRQLFQQLIQNENTTMYDGYKQLSHFNNLIFASKENQDSMSGFSFLVLQYDANGKVIFRSITGEFQNAMTTMLLRANLGLLPNG